MGPLVKEIIIMGGGSGSPNAEFCLHVDAPRFLPLLVSRIQGTGGRPSLRWHRRRSGQKEKADVHA